jgi:hypothetical protein
MDVFRRGRRAGVQLIKTGEIIDSQRVDVNADATECGEHDALQMVASVVLPNHSFSIHTPRPSSSQSPSLA